MSRLNRHLQEVGEGYFEHLGKASGFAVEMALGSVACMVHALLPFAFEKTGSRAISRLYERMLVNRVAKPVAERLEPSIRTSRSPRLS